MVPAFVLRSTFVFEINQVFCLSIAWTCGRVLPKNMLHSDILAESREGAGETQTGWDR